MELERKELDFEVSPTQIDRITSSYAIPLDEDYTDKPFIGTTTEMKLERPPRTTLEMLQAPASSPDMPLGMTYESYIAHLAEQAGMTPEEYIAAQKKDEQMNLNLNFGGNNPATTQKTSSGSVPVWIWILGGFVILLLLTIILVSIFKKKK